MYKIVTSILSLRFTAIMERHHLWALIQGGAIPGKTCGGKVLTLVNVISHSIRHQKELHVLIIDIANAYPSTVYQGFVDGFCCTGFDPDFIQLHDKLQRGF